LEPGPAPGTLRFSLATLYGSNFEGGHFTTEGNTPDGTSIAVPLYRHEVSLDYARVELGLQYTLSNEWDLLARIPWEQKRQNASIEWIEPATPDEQAAMQRNVDLHHRTVTLRGFGDAMLLGRRRWPAVLRADDVLTLSGGITVPIGRTIENPYDLGDRGLQHLHIQFGSGTFDPLLEASYHAPIRGRLTAGGYLSGRFPFYENDHTFRAAPDATFGAHLAFRPTDAWQLRVEGALYAQGHASWDGERDENTGLFATSIGAGVTRKLRAVSLSADVRYPLSQRTLEEGDAFTQGPTFVVTIGGTLWSAAATPPLSR